MKPDEYEKKSQVRATQERRRSGAAGKHADKREKRARTRAAQFARAMKESE
jgi:hypothetical protein